MQTRIYAKVLDVSIFIAIILIAILRIAIITLRTRHITRRPS